MTTLFCPIRKCFCKSLPEEKVRIELIQRMVHDLSFPLHTLTVEKELQHLPHFGAGVSIPKRRADILCLVNGLKAFSIYPLLMIECKSVKITEKVLDQVCGYNHFVKACFICVANQTEIRTGWRSANGSYEYVSYLPTYLELKNSVVF